MLAAIGWTHFAGLTAVLVASVGLAIATTGSVALAFLLGIALPAWWIGYLALLARPGASNADVEWYPVGRIVVWTAIAAALVVLVTMLRYGFDATQIQAGLRRELERALRFLAGAPANSPLQFPGVRGPRAHARCPRTHRSAPEGDRAHRDQPAQPVARGADRPHIGPPEAAVAADRADDVSPFAATALAIAVAGTFLPDLIGLASGVFTASLLLAYALLGLAVLHAITVGLTGRGFMLTGLYFTVGLFGWPIVLMSLLGLIETIAALRARSAARRRPPTLPGPPHHP